MTNTENLPIERVHTKHGYKARLVTPAQEATLDALAKDPFTAPIVAVNVLHEDFGNVAQVIVTDGEWRSTGFLIATNGHAMQVEDSR